MKVSTAESGPLLIIHLEDGKNCTCRIEDILLDDQKEIDDMSYSLVWNQVCKEVFGSHLFGGKNFTTGGYAIFYYRSRFKLIANLQKSHLQFTAHMANLEIERLDKLLEKKYGTQLKLGVE